MKIKLFATINTLCILLASFSFDNHVFKKANATTDDIHEIGYLYTLENVSTVTKVIINQEHIFTYLNDIGRTYTYEWIDAPIGDDPTPGVFGIGETSEPNIIVHRVKQYYYYATPTKPKIVGRTMMYNTIASVKKGIEYLESFADLYGCKDRNNSILSYLRTINTNYNTDNWASTAGAADTNFINYVDSISDVGMTIREFFASFIRSDHYNESLHGTCTQQYLTNDYLMYDPITGNADIDLIHMFASMDGAFKNTGTSFLLTMFVTQRTIAYLSTWAGDLQQCTKYISNNNISITDFDQIFNSEYGFSVEDFYADIDAIGMTCGITISNSFYLSTLFNNYYQGLSTNESRIMAFCENIIYMDNENETLTFNNLKTIIYEMLAMNASGSSIGNSLNSTHLIKYRILGYTAPLTNLPDVSIRLNIGSLFLDYLWEACY